MQPNPEISFSSSGSDHSKREFRKKKTLRRSRSKSESAKSDKSKDQPKQSRSRSRSASPPAKNYESRRGDRQSEDQGRFDGYRGGRDSRRPRKIAFPSFNKPLMTKKDFENYQDSRFDRQEVQDGYNDYVAKYKREQEYDFYREHRTDPWFVERYDPSEVFKWKQIQNQLC